MYDGYRSVRGHVVGARFEGMGLSACNGLPPPPTAAVCVVSDADGAQRQPQGSGAHVRVAREWVGAMLMVGGEGGACRDGKRREHTA